MRALQLCKIVILASWICFFGWLTSFGQESLGLLLHPGLWWLVTTATVILALFLAVNLRRRMATAQHEYSWLHWPALLILLAPLLYFFPAQKGRFNAGTLEKRVMQTDSGFIAGDLSSTAPADTAYPPLLEKKEAPADIPLNRLAMNPQEYQGQEVEVVCKTFNDKRLPQDQFMCYRYLITCCVADAMPVFIFIKYPEARSIKNDVWIHAKGAFSIIENVKGHPVPSIQTDTVLFVDEPPFPYLY